MENKMEVAKKVADAFRIDSVSIILDDLDSGKAVKLYEELQTRYWSVPDCLDTERRWEILRPIAKAMDALWEYVQKDIMEANGITCIKTASRIIHMETFRFMFNYDQFFVDIELDTLDKKYEAWLYAENCGVKEYMFGSLVNSTRFGQPETETLESFRNLVIANLPEYLPDYIEQHMSEN